MLRPPPYEKAVIKLEKEKTFIFVLDGCDVWKKHIEIFCSYTIEYFDMKGISISFPPPFPLHLFFPP